MLHKFNIRNAKLFLRVLIELVDDKSRRFDYFELKNRRRKESTAFTVKILNSDSGDSGCTTRNPCQGYFFIGTQFLTSICH